MDSKNVIIFSQSKDSHACAVDYALKMLGQQPFIFNTGNVANGEYLTANYRDKGLHVRIGEYDGYISDVCSSWNRRITRDSILPSDSHPADKRFIQDNARATLTGMLRLLDDGFAVNPIASSRIFSNKLAQLREASVAGFRVPHTIVSNNFSDISDFVNAMQDVCFKPYYSRGWLTDTGPVHAMTTKLTREQLGDQRSFELMPHIFQEYIPKKSEYRLTMFGQYSSAVKIMSDRLSGHATTDWRANPSYLKDLAPCRLPEAVTRAARAVMDALGLRFGTFDLAETHDGEFYFFEVNESGQWLWTEIHCPECELLQPFCEYLTAASDGFTWSKDRSRPDLRAGYVCKEVEANVGERYKSLFEAEFPDKAIMAADERAEPFLIV